MDRRTFLKAALVAALTLGPMNALASEQTRSPKILSLYNTHTEEFLKVTFRDETGYIPKSLAKIDHILRCHHNDEVHRMDPRLLDLVHQIDYAFGGGNIIRVVSGYRSPEYNAMLARRSRGVARKSLHMQGMALDFSIDGISNGKLYKTARSLKSGGTGIYPGFVHVDVGDVRTWGDGSA